MPLLVVEHVERPASFFDALEALERASKTRAKQRTVKISTHVDTICRHAFDAGLDANALRKLVQIVSKKTELDQPTVTGLIKNFYPYQRIPADVIVTIVAALGQGQGKPSLGTQNSLTKWLTIVHDIIEDPNILSRLYGVLFGMLDMISIRTPLCHLLSLITRRKHVKPFRIQALLELSRSLGNEPALQGLLRVYKDYYPEIILASTAIGRNAFRPELEPEWQKRILVIQENRTAVDDTTSEQPNGFRVLRKGLKRSRPSAIPSVHTFRASESSVTLEEIDGVEAFVGKLERIEPPGQMVSFLDDTLMQKYVALKPSSIVSQRVELWLGACLEEEYSAVKSGLESSSCLSEILQSLYRHTQFTKVLMPIVSVFLQDYIKIWDGISDIDATLGLLSYLPVQPFEDVYVNFLGPAERAMVRVTPLYYEKLLHMYTALLQHWACRICNANSADPRSSVANSGPNALKDLVAHVNKLSTSLILSIPTTSQSPLISSIISFYEALSSSSRPSVVLIVLPPPHLAYLLAQSSSTAVFSRICGVYACYKIAFDRHPTPISSYYPTTMTIPFNSCLRDLFNMIWASRALDTKQSDGFFCDPSLRQVLNTYLRDIDRDYDISVALNLSYNPLLSSLSAVAWKHLENDEIERQGYTMGEVRLHTGPVSQRSSEALRVNQGVNVGFEKYKISVLEWLTERGLGGVKELMYSTNQRLKGIKG